MKWFSICSSNSRETPPQSAPQARSVGGKIRLIKGFTYKQNGAFFAKSSALLCKNCLMTEMS